MNVLTVVQARSGSSRLPGKVLLPLVGQPAIVRMLERVARARTASNLWIATTSESKDDHLADVVRRAKYSVFRGSEADVLSRFAQLARQESADVVVRLTGDCPLHDPSVIDTVVETFLTCEQPVEYGSNVHPPTFPNGLDVEVFTADALYRADRDSKNPFEREHVTLGIHKQRHRGSVKPDIINILAPADFSTLRWTLDTQEDYRVISRVYDALYPDHPEFAWHDVLALNIRQPHLFEVNSGLMRNENVERAIEEGVLEQ